MKSSPNSKAESLKAEYAKLSDGKLIFMATSEHYDLEPMGLKALKEEIKERELFDEQDFQRTFSYDSIAQEELDFYVELIETLPCPRCGSEDSILKSRTIRWVLSAIFFSEIEEREMIGCKGCLKKWTITSHAKTLFLGWWHIPRGVINVGKVVYRSYLLSRMPERESQAGLENFIRNNIGHLRAYKGDRDKLVFLLYRHNF